ncbi:FAD-dependent monooxygenase [Mycolicibacterium brisbanense]|uniref:Salicylate 1-monooxygenase n=1 Tax=Mycolicibacterium brisbanense TaxID=146020 RepID=A0A100VY80_9MYCO|nr:FAD-dependent monooxygenase [Mycolicibacterium brisbanense]MCV7161013.1 FAD-dependent monooxygenase [Mycolicibacterium brisbanense]GAS88194.1 salicylate 1-monooxygenase [Mycolicibacterium brisbanense]
MVNIVAVRESSDWVEESWTVPSSQAALLEAFDGWNEDLIRLFKMSDPSEIFAWCLFDRDPMSQWGKGRLTLLGDAAHPMLPFLSQGASMAIEDAYVLGKLLGRYPDPTTALRLYENERISRTSKVQLAARERGKTYHLPARWS